jgi:hypothetical protein
VWWRSRRNEPPSPVDLADSRPDTAELSRELLATNALRAQALAERLLLTIEDAERQEDDPGRLDFLFEIDHLATRLRRESERQLLFADRVPAPMAPEPAPLADVIRIAVGHCAEYQRVRIAELPAERIDNAVAEDLPHLLAELIDNGLALSPALAQVRVSGYVLGGGGLLIQIDDEGIGMDETLFAELNAGLRIPTEPGDLERPHTGLRLVGLIAQRHLLQIRLHPGVPRGVSAQVMIPEASVYAPQDGPSPSPSRTAPVDHGRRETPLLRPRFTPHGDTGPGDYDGLANRTPLPQRPAGSVARHEAPPPDPEPGDVEQATADVADFSEGWEGPWQG